MIVAKKCSFDAAHYLPNHAGKCANLHGHHWVVELGVRGEVKPETGMVIDFQVLNRFLKVLVDKYDHALLNDFITNPTAENIASEIKSYWERGALEEVVELAFVRVWETENSMVEIA